MYGAKVAACARLTLPYFFFGQMSFISGRLMLTDSGAESVKNKGVMRKGWVGSLKGDERRTIYYFYLNVS